MQAWSHLHLCATGQCRRHQRRVHYNLHISYMLLPVMPILCFCLVDSFSPGAYVMK